MRPRRIYFTKAAGQPDLTPLVVLGLVAIHVSAAPSARTSGTVGRRTIAGRCGSFECASA
jgi:hypothetical protein